MFFVRVKFEKDVALAGYPFNVIVPERVPAAIGIGYSAYAVLLFIVGTALFYITLLLRKRLPHEKMQKWRPRIVEKVQARRSRAKQVKRPRQKVKQKIKEAAHDYWDEMQKFVRR